MKIYDQKTIRSDNIIRVGEYRKTLERLTFKKKTDAEWEIFVA